MSKKRQKKRSKKYSGEDASRQKSVVHKYTAVERSRLGEWYQDNKVTVYTRLIQIVAAIIISGILFLIYLWIFQP